MTKRLVFLGLLAALVTTSAKADAVDDAVEYYRTSSHIPGVAVAVIADGKIDKLAAYGVANLEWDGAVTVDTPFQTASASKVLTGALLMRLVEQGIVSLDDPVTRYLPDAPDSWRAITFRRMASHMSGLPEGLGLAPSATPQDFVDAAMKRPLEYQPGTQSRYGMTDFVVMTAALEKATGLSFADLLDREIVKPLSLRNTGFDYATEGRPAKPSNLMRKATTYYWDGERQHEDRFLYPIHGYAAGGLFSSARDLGVLFAALQRGEFLKPSSFDQLTTPSKLESGDPGAFAIGWTSGVYRGERVFGHSGGPALADIMYVPARRLTIVALGNQRRFFPLLAQTIADTRWPEPQRAKSIKDRRPGLTQKVRLTLMSLQKGAPEDGDFNSTGAGDKDFLGGFGQALLTAVGPVESVELLFDEQTGSQVRRMYRIGFKAREMIWLAQTDASGRYSALHPASDEAR